MLLKERIQLTGENRVLPSPFPLQISYRPVQNRIWISSVRCPTNKHLSWLSCSSLFFIKFRFVRQRNTVKIHQNIKQSIMFRPTVVVYCKFKPLAPNDIYVCRAAQLTSRRCILTLWRRIFFFQILAHSVFKMWVIQKPNEVALWNKRHFKEKKMEIIEHV